MIECLGLTGTAHEPAVGRRGRDVLDLLQEIRGDTRDHFTVGVQERQRDRALPQNPVERS